MAKSLPDFPVSAEANGELLVVGMETAEPIRSPVSADSPGPVQSAKGHLAAKELKQHKRSSFASFASLARAVCFSHAPVICALLPNCFRAKAARLAKWSRRPAHHPSLPLPIALPATAGRPSLIRPYPA